MIKDIVVNLNLGDRDPAGDYAISMAETFEAHVLGVAFAYEPLVPGSAMGSLPAQFFDTQREEAGDKARKAAARFTEAARRAGISAETRIIDTGIAGAADQLGQLARRFDIAIAGQADRKQATADEVVDEGLLFGAGRPVIFVPFIQRGGMTLGRVMIAWDGSRAAARAVADSLPLLGKAKAVEIVIVGSKEGKRDQAPGADLGQHLARHGLNVEVKRLTSPDIGIAATLLSYAADSSAELIVMGGYGHSRLREFVLGGVTRGILESMTVPVLMSH